MTVALYAEFTARPGTEPAIARLVRELARRVRQEPGNLAFEASTLQTSPRRWFIYEVYQDDAAFHAHISAEYGAAFNSALVPLIEEDGSRLTWLSPVV